MVPSLPLPTDNLYKFACLFGLTLMVVSVLGMVSLYNVEQDRLVRTIEAAHAAAVKQDQPGVQNAVSLYEAVGKATRIHFAVAALVLSCVMFMGLAISAAGAVLWKRRIQTRDDRMAELQLRKLELEVARLEQEGSPEPGGRVPA